MNNNNNNSSNQHQQQEQTQVKRRRSITPINSNNTSTIQSNTIVSLIETEINSLRDNPIELWSLLQPILTNINHLPYSMIQQLESRIHNCARKYWRLYPPEWIGQFIQYLTAEDRSKLYRISNHYRTVINHSKSWINSYLELPIAAAAQSNQLITALTGPFKYINSLFISVSDGTSSDYLLEGPQLGNKYSNSCNSFKTVFNPLLIQLTQLTSIKFDMIYLYHTDLRELIDIKQQLTTLIIYSTTPRYSTTNRLTKAKLLNISKLSGLLVLSIEGGLRMNLEGLQYLNQLQQLQSLILIDVMGLIAQWETQIQFFQPLSTGGLLKSIRCINLNSSYIANQTLQLIVKEAELPGSRLESLSIAHHSNTAHPCRLTGEILQSIGNIQRLLILDLSRQSALTDLILFAICSKCRLLQSLVLDGCSALTGAGLIQLLTSTEKLLSNLTRFSLSLPGNQLNNELIQSITIRLTNLTVFRLTNSISEDSDSDDNDDSDDDNDSETSISNPAIESILIKLKSLIQLQLPADCMADTADLIANSNSQSLIDRLVLGEIEWKSICPIAIANNIDNNNNNNNSIDTHMQVQ